MNQFRKNQLMRRILRNTDFSDLHYTRAGLKMESELKELNSLTGLLRSQNYSFREGFADRTLTRLVHKLDYEPYQEYYAKLSGLFPRLATGFLSLVVLVIITVLLVHGDLNSGIITGYDKVNDSNFISYLILQGK